MGILLIFSFLFGACILWCCVRAGKMADRKMDQIQKEMKEKPSMFE